MKQELISKLSSRITIDIDDKDLSLPLLKIFLSLEKVNIKKLIIRESSNKGYHIIIFASNPLSHKEIFRLRKFIGDDKKRIRIDKKRKFPKQYLFYKKEFLNRKV